MTHRSRPKPRHTAEAIAARPPGPSPLTPEHTMPIPALVQPGGQSPPPGHAAGPPPVRPAEPAPVVRHAAAAFREDLRELQHFRATIRTRGWNGLHMRAPGTP